MRRFTPAFVLLLAAISYGQTLPGTQPLAGAVSTAEIKSEGLYDFYAKNLRQSFFTGFLTLGSFLVAVNTFIIVNIKRELYDHPLYKNKVMKQRVEVPTSSFYGPLRRLSALIVYAVFTSIITSVSQLTVGVFIPNAFGAGICILLAFCTIGLLFYVLKVTRENLHDWFDHCEEQAKIDEENEKAKRNLKEPP